MANPNFGSILDRQSTDIERPKPHPIGNYLFVVKGVPEYGESAQKKTPFVRFTCAPMQAMDDVDADDLEAFLARKDGSKRTLPDMTKPLTFYITEDATWRLVKFLDDCGAGEPSMSIRERIDNSSGCQFVGTIKHEASDDGTAIYANIAGTAAVE